MREIVRRYGGTPEQWRELIRSGKLRGSKPLVTSTNSVRRKLLSAYIARAVARALAQDAPPLPRIVVRDKVAFVEGTSVPVRRLERARRAGSSEADLRAAFPDLPPRALDAVAAYVRRFPKTAHRWAELLAPAHTPPGDVDDDGQGFDEELEGLLASHAELFRRLAR